MLRRFMKSLRLTVFATLSLHGLQLQHAMAEEFVFGDRTLRVPDGYEVEQVTTTSLVERPIAVARDEQGRLYVTDSGGMTERAEQQLAEKPHRIRRLEDTDGDGRFDRSTLFADRMMFPEGCMWRDGSLYVAAPPEIWKLTDDNDDGVADRREVWFDGKTLTGCGNDLHGPYPGPDGMIYWCKGAFAQQEHPTILTAQPFVTQASHIFRARPDGSEIEPVLTGGMDNPVNVAFLSTGERFLSCTFFQHPEAGRRDGLIHAIYGGVYGKKHDSIYAHPMTGDVMPVLSHQGAAAPCGLIAESEVLFGGEPGDHLLACYFNLHKVVRHKLIADGPTFTTEDQDFVACDHPDFHPTDVYEDADGSLLVVDTGGWYKVCCPTSQLAKPDVMGAIYRIRRRGHQAPADPFGRNIHWEELTADQLADLLADNRLFVQRRAIELLRLRGDDAVGAITAILRTHKSVSVRQQATWVLASLTSEASINAVRIAIRDQSPEVRQTAAHVAGLIRNASIRIDLESLLSDSNPGVARAAAEAVGRIGEPNSFGAISKAIDQLKPTEIDWTGAPSDSAARISEHSLIYAMMQTAAPLSLQTAAGSKQSPALERAILVATDQWPGLMIEPSMVYSRLRSSEPSVRATATWIIRQHPEWAEQLLPELVRFLNDVPNANELSRSQTAELLARLAESTVVQQLLAKQLAQAVPETTHTVALAAMSQSGLPQTPEIWLESLADYLTVAGELNLQAALDAVRSWPQPKMPHEKLRSSLLSLAARTSLEPTLRIQAIGLSGSGVELTDEMFQLLSGVITGDTSLDQRTTAAQILATARLSADQRIQMLGIARAAGPMELPRLLPAFESDGTEQYGLQLVSALKDSSGFRGLRVDLIRPLLTRYPASVQQAGEPLLTSLNASAAEQAANLDRMLKEMPTGDLRRGHEVFMSKKAACITCHKLGYGGGRLGPDLTSIGRARNQRDLLEAIVYPSASIVRGYEPVSVSLNDGRIVSGIVISEDRDGIVISLDAQKTFSISRDTIEEIIPSSVSPMPNGVATLLTPQELADLIEFLRNPDK
ncbi:MAG: HEAT repeat domain-containing protein [Planctomyces sp.]|nr:HEAT repeat domain-containing protein [Planctomyces sp.]